MNPAGRGKVIISYGVGHEDAPMRHSYLISYEEENIGPGGMRCHPWTWHRQTMDDIDDAMIYAEALAKKYNAEIVKEIGETREQYLRSILSEQDFEDWKRRKEQEQLEQEQFVWKRVRRE